MNLHKLTQTDVNQHELTQTETNSHELILKLTFPVKCPKSLPLLFHKKTVCLEMKTEKGVVSCADWITKPVLIIINSVFYIKIAVYIV
jgi:hypothetical protein